MVTVLVYWWMSIRKDLYKKLFSLDVDGNDFNIDIRYENLPLFYSACKNIGHAISFCRLV